MRDILLKMILTRLSETIQLVDELVKLDTETTKIPNPISVNDMPMVRKYLHPNIRTLHNFDIKPDLIVAHINDNFSCDIRVKSRLHSVVKARDIASWLMHKYSKITLKDISAAVGNIDHATVLYAVNKVTKKMGTDEFYKAEVERLANELWEKYSNPEITTLNGVQ